MDFLRLSRRANWFIWMVNFTLAPIAGLAVCIWLGAKLWGMPFPGGDDVKIIVVIMGFVLGSTPHIFNLMAYGLAAPENHNQILAFYRQMRTGLIVLLVVGLVVREITSDGSEIILGLLTALLLWFLLMETFRSVSIASYVWRNARSETTFRQYLLDHHFTFFRR